MLVSPVMMARPVTQEVKSSPVSSDRRDREALLVRRVLQEIQVSKAPRASLGRKVREVREEQARGDRLVREEQQEHLGRRVHKARRVLRGLRDREERRVSV